MTSATGDMSGYKKIINPYITEESGGSKSLKDRINVVSKHRWWTALFETKVYRNEQID